tara:strand:+ start:330 stop:638 length:309 start_codon:yes stop_codon:yes gene_type:complete
MKTIKKNILGKNYNLFIAKTYQEKKIGMNIFKKPPKRTGMIFSYNEELPNRSFTLSKTPFPLYVIFLDKNNHVIYYEKCSANRKHPVVCKKPSLTVLEISLD